MKTWEKDPNSVLDYEWDWSSWLDTDNISQVSLVATGGLVIDSSTIGDGIVTVWISGGTVGTQGMVTCSITTSEGRKEDRSAIFIIKQR